MFNFKVWEDFLWIYQFWHLKAVLFFTGGKLPRHVHLRKPVIMQITRASSRKENDYLQFTESNDFCIVLYFILFFIYSFLIWFLICLTGLFRLQKSVNLSSPVLQLSQTRGVNEITNTTSILQRSMTTTSCVHHSGFKIQDILSARPPTSSQRNG